MEAVDLQEDRVGFGDVRQHSCALGFTQDSRPGAFSAVPSGLVSVAKVHPGLTSWATLSRPLRRAQGRLYGTVPTHSDSWLVFSQCCPNRLMEKKLIWTSLTLNRPWRTEFGNRQVLTQPPQPVRKWLQIGPAPATEGTLFKKCLARTTRLERPKRLDAVTT